MSDDQLTQIRRQLDQIDEQIQTLLNQRATLALEVAKIKNTLDDNPIYYRPEREAEIMRRLQQRNQGPLSNAAQMSIFRAIISACLAIQKPTRVAYLGPAGTFSQAASLKHFGSEIETLPTQTISDVFLNVSNHQAEYGVVPIQNSSQGIINQTLQCLTQTTLTIVGEILLPIRHHLLRGTSDHTPLKRIYAHQQSFAQCQNWLHSHLPGVEQISVSSNGNAAKRAQTELGAAAIAGDNAVDEYGLTKVYQNIQDDCDNTTRFLVLGEQTVAASGDDKTSLLITAQDQPGTLLKLLKPFADNKVNLTLIESRHNQHQQHPYLFLLDANGHQTDDTMQTVLKALQRMPVTVTILGSYPQAI